MLLLLAVSCQMTVYTKLFTPSGKGMRFIPTVYSQNGGSLPRSDARAKADFIRQHVKHGWSESDATARYELWVVQAIDSNPDLDAKSHQQLADQAITSARNSSRTQD
jgi:hypothetical protein